MNAKNENSMMMALADLRNIEAERLAEEAAQRAAEARREAEQRAREQKERELKAQQKLAEELLQQRIAEAEARLRVVELQRAEQLQRQAEELAHELRVKKVEHGLLSAQLGSLEAGVSHVSQRWRWRLVGSVSGCLLLGFLAVLAIGPKLARVPPPSLVKVQPAAIPAAVPSDKLREQIDAEVKRRVATMEQQLLAMQTVQKSLAPPARPVLHRPSIPQRPVVPTDLSKMATDCQDDPLCGISSSPANRPASRP